MSDFWLPDTQVTFSRASVTVPAGGTATVGVDIVADPVEPTAPDFLGFPTGGLYGGYLKFRSSSTGDVVFSVPYMGFKGDYQSIVATPNGAVIGKLSVPFMNAPQMYTLAPANEVWTLQTPEEIPNIVLHFAHQVRTIELQVVNAATGTRASGVHQLPRAELPRAERHKPPPGGPYEGDENVLAFPWDGTRMHDNGNGTADHRKVVPDGSYKIVVKALKARRHSRQPGALGDAYVADDHDRPPVTGSRDRPDGGPAQAGPPSSPQE